MRARLRNGEMNVERELGEQGMTRAEGQKQDAHNRFQRLCYLDLAFDLVDFSPQLRFVGGLLKAPSA